MLAENWEDVKNLVNGAQRAQLQSARILAALDLSSLQKLGT